jgi:hypothetical protein
MHHYPYDTSTPPYALNSFDAFIDHQTAGNPFVIQCKPWTGTRWDDLRLGVIVKTLIQNVSTKPFITCNVCLNPGFLVSKGFNRGGGASRPTLQVRCDSHLCNKSSRDVTCEEIYWNPNSSIAQNLRDANLTNYIYSNIKTTDYRHHFYTAPQMIPLPEKHPLFFIIETIDNPDSPLSDPCEPDDDQLDDYIDEDDEHIAANTTGYHYSFSEDEDEGVVPNAPNPTQCSFPGVSSPVKPMYGDESFETKVINGSSAKRTRSVDAARFSHVELLEVQERTALLNHKVLEMEVDIQDLTKDSTHRWLHFQEFMDGQVEDTLAHSNWLEKLQEWAQHNGAILTIQQEKIDSLQTQLYHALTKTLALEAILNDLPNKFQLSSETNDSPQPQSPMSTQGDNSPPVTPIDATETSPKTTSRPTVKSPIETSANPDTPATAKPATEAIEKPSAPPATTPATETIARTRTRPTVITPVPSTTPMPLRFTHDVKLQSLHGAVDPIYNSETQHRVRILGFRSNHYRGLIGRDVKRQLLRELYHIKVTSTSILNIHVVQDVIELMVWADLSGDIVHVWDEWDESYKVGHTSESRARLLQIATRPHAPAQLSRFINGLLEETTATNTAAVTAEEGAPSTQGEASHG